MSSRPIPTADSMKVLEVSVENIRAVETLHWSVPNVLHPEGWHVILGDNGSGKSTFLQSLAAGILGLDSLALVDYDTWLRKGTNQGRISVNLLADADDEVQGGNRSRIVVIGVGTGGSNAVEYMYDNGIPGVEFVVCNTSIEALNKSTVPNKLLLGAGLTRGFGSGGRIALGKQAANKSTNQIRDLFSTNTKIAFVVAGMGGGTGTGASQVVAKAAKELGILTIGIVTVPFSFEGAKRYELAKLGIEELRDNCDSTVVIYNDNLRNMFGKMVLRGVFRKADIIMMSTVESITRLLTNTSDVNIDFEDVKSVMRDAGMAAMTFSIKSGENRAREAIEEAMNSPLINKLNTKSSQKVLLSIMTGGNPELEMDELTEITSYIEKALGHDAEMIFGHGINENLGSAIQVIIVLTGFNTSSTDLLSREALIDLSKAPKPPITEASESINMLSDFGPSIKNHVEKSLSEDANTYQLKLNFVLDKETGKVIKNATESGRTMSFQSSWSDSKGWFSAGFGPFRRFTGGDPEVHKMLSKDQYKRFVAHMTLFMENVALAEALQWLKDLKFDSLESHRSDFLNRLQEFINQPNFLPHGTRFEEVNSKGVFFRDVYNNRISIDELSDGFRSVLSLCFELMRRLEERYTENVFSNIDDSGVIYVKVSGVVLIDEIDAHLHPIWQKQIGYWLTRHFPNIQFFVTTHSPLVCQAAEHGSVFYLPVPGSDVPGGMVEGTELNRLIYGNVLEAYGTEVFGLVHTQSDAGQAKTSRLTDLNEKALTSILSQEEMQERNNLRATLPISDSEAFIKKLLSGE